MNASVRKASPTPTHAQNAVAPKKEALFTPREMVLIFALIVGGGSVIAALVLAFFSAMFIFAG